MLGRTVEVRTFDELKDACTSTEPLTIIVTGKISGRTGSQNYQISTGHDNGKRYYCRDNCIYLQPNKTIIGSYAANSLYKRNCFCFVLEKKSDDISKCFTYAGNASFHS